MLFTQSPFSAAGIRLHGSQGVSYPGTGLGVLPSCCILTFTLGAGNIIHLYFTDEETEAQKHLQRCRWDLKPALSLHIRFIPWSLKGPWGLPTCPGAPRRSRAGGSLRRRRPPDPGRAPALPVQGDGWTRGSQAGGPPVQRRRGVNQHGVRPGSYSEFTVTEA